jgi:hypothetical protein
MAERRLVSTLHLSSEKLVSKFAFIFNLYRYDAVLTVDDDVLVTRGLLTCMLTTLARHRRGCTSC